MNYLDEELPENFLENTIPCPISGCWFWIGSVFTRGGYARYTLNSGDRVRGHRVSYEVVFGPIQSDLEIDHKCRVTCCVNPHHLEAVTHKVNILRGTSVAASKAKQTHCIRCHEFNAENTSFRPNGTRRCRICHNTKERERRR